MKFFVKENHEDDSDAAVTQTAEDVGEGLIGEAFMRTDNTIDVILFDEFFDIGRRSKDGGFALAVDHVIVDEDPTHEVDVGVKIGDEVLGKELVPG